MFLEFSLQLAILVYYQILNISSDQWGGCLNNKPIQAASNQILALS